MKFSVKKLLNLKNVALLGIFSVFLLNVSYLVIKQAQVLSGWEKRSSKDFDAFIKEHIPSGSKVVAEPLAYYAVRKANSDMQLINLYDTLPSREYKHRVAYDYDYLILTKSLALRHPNVVNLYLQNASFDTVARYHVPSNTLNQFVNSLGLVSTTEEFGYDCLLLRRVK